MTKQQHVAPAATNVDAVASEAPKVNRRKFLAGAAGAAGAAVAGFPMISVAQSPIVLKMQGAWARRTSSTKWPSSTLRE